MTKSSTNKVNVTVNFVGSTKPDVQISLPVTPVTGDLVNISNCNWRVVERIIVADSDRVFILVDGTCRR